MRLRDPHGNAALAARNRAAILAQQLPTVPTLAETSREFVGPLNPHVGTPPRRRAAK